MGKKYKTIKDGNRRHAPGNNHPAMNNYRYNSGGGATGGQPDDRFRDSTSRVDGAQSSGYFGYGRDSPMVASDASRRLFFSPAYFDPELLKVLLSHYFERIKMKYTAYIL